MFRFRCATAYSGWAPGVAKHGSEQIRRARAVRDAIGYDETWHLFVNVRREELRGSAGLGQRKTIRKNA
jgi:hypothetical protein